MTTHSARLIPWLRIFLLPNMGPQTYLKTLSELGDPHGVLNAELETLRNLGWSAAMVSALHHPHNYTSALKELETALDNGIEILTLHDPAYPKNLLTSPYRVPLLYLKGHLEAKDENAVAVVGTRRASPYGLDCAKTIIKTLCAEDTTVVSGLAKGIDRCAHHTCLEEGGRTLAVLGQGLLTLNPHLEKDWVHPICQQGAVLSQFPLYFQGNRYTYPMRNRILTGLSRATIVCESGTKGGALITAQACIEEGKDLIAVPYPMDKNKESGSNRLIAQGAHCLCHPRDLHHLLTNTLSLNPRLRKKPLNKPKSPRVPRQPNIYNELWEKIEAPRIHLDQLIQRAGLSRGVLLQQLTQLELQGFIQSLPGGYYSRV